MLTHVHLATHSSHTLLGATPTPEALANRAAAEGMTHLALTDTHALYGVPAFDRACRAVGVQPILGMDVTVAWPADLVANGVATMPAWLTRPGHLTLLAQDAGGYRALCRLSSLMQGHADREARLRRGLTLAELRANAEGLVCLTGGRRGFAYRCLAHGEEAPAHRFIGKLCGIYEPARTFVALELQPGAQDRNVLRAITSQLAAKAAFLGLQTVAVQPIASLAPDDRERLRLLAAIDRNCELDELPPDALPDGGDPGVSVHWLDPEEMRARFAEYPDALARTREIAEICTPTTGSVLPSGELMWPKPALPAGQSAADALRRQAEEGSARRYGLPLPDGVHARLEHELTAIATHGYDPLFLVVADIVRYAREREIPVSTRGSVANSLVAYALGITTVDPIAHGLLFERFLNPGRADPPDIDLDFCSRRRDEVQDYVRSTYGEEHVALVGAMSTLQLRSAARETAKAYRLSESELEEILAALPRRFYGPRSHEAPSAEEVVTGLPNERLRQVARAAYSIEGFPHHLSVHACGMVITPGPLTDLVPVQMAPKGYLTTQYDHGDCEAIGLPKLDLLGIRALTVLADAAEEARLREPDFRLDDIPLDDAQTAELLMAGDTIGVFQCDSVGARRTLRKLKARTIADLAVANAFFKPGPATGGQADVFVRRYRGEAPTHYQHPALEPILAPTKGVLIFQEQVLRVATEVAGLSWAEADHIRRGMSKMRPEEMRELQSAFVAGCLREDGPGFTRAQAEQLWAQVSAFSGYGFNQGHATAYADVSYRSAYMKAHYPAAFFFARLRNYGGYHHPAIYMAEAIRLGIDVRLPHVNHSFASVVLRWEPQSPHLAKVSGTFARLDGEPPPGPEPLPTLWLGLQLIRDLRRQAVAGLIRARKAGPFADLRDLLLRVDLQPKEITHLIQAGALDGLGANRPAMLAEAGTMARAGSAQQMAFDFAAGYAPEASRPERLAWERHLVGYPLTALRPWLAELAAQTPSAQTPSAQTPSAQTPSAVSLAEIASTRGAVTVAGARLPGWHRGGYGLWDSTSWVWAEAAEGARSPRAWDPALFRGRWEADRWGMGRFVVQRWMSAK